MTGGSSIEILINMFHENKLSFIWPEYEYFPQVNIISYDIMLYCIDNECIVLQL